MLIVPNSRPKYANMIFSPPDTMRNKTNMLTISTQKNARHYKGAYNMYNIDHDFDFILMHDLVIP